MARRKKAKKRKRISNLRQQYLKERKRVSSIVSRLRKKGYDITLKDIVGDIPKRVTKKRLTDIAAIKTGKQLLEQNPDLPKRAPATPTQAPEPFKWEYDITMSADDYAIYLFREQFYDYQLEVQKAINAWIDYVLEHFGKEELSAALDEINYEGIELSRFGGYLIPVDDLALYLHQISHFIIADDKADLFALVERVDEIAQQYNVDIQGYDVEAWGSWSLSGKRRKIINQEYD